MDAVQTIDKARDRAKILVLQPQLAMEGSFSAAVVTAFGPHLAAADLFFGCGKGAS
jgi:hypothetical protein